MKRSSHSFILAISVLVARWEEPEQYRHEACITYISPPRNVHGQLFVKGDTEDDKVVKPSPHPGLDRTVRQPSENFGRHSGLSDLPDT